MHHNAVFTAAARAAVAGVASILISACAAEPDRLAEETTRSSTEAQATALELDIRSCAEGEVGVRVASGECTDLASAALACAGACAASAPYVWGDLVPNNGVQPGDVVQFTSAKTVSGNSWMLRGDPHHTAVVESVNGGVLGLLEQNINGSATQRGTFDPSALVSGSYQVFRARDCRNAPPPPPPPPGQPAVAIAYSKVTHYAGMARAGSVALAEAAAIRFCGQGGGTDCVVVVSRPSGCVSQWLGNNAQGTGAAPTSAAAEQWANHYCSLYGPNCAHFASVCGSGAQ